MNCPNCSYDMSSWRNTFSGAHFWECGACLRAGKISRVPIEDRPATFTTACARCAVPLEVAGHEEDELADAHKAHEERCIVAGDAVECQVHAGKWWPATISVVISRDDFEVEHTDLMGTRSWWRASRANLRRIPRPEQAVKPSKPDLFDRMLDAHYPRDANGKHYLPAPPPLPNLAKLTKAKRERVGQWIQTVDYPRQVERLADQMVKHLAAPTPKSPTADFIDRLRADIGSTVPVFEVELPDLYDGLTADECLARWSGNRTCVEHGQPPLFAMTAVQIAEAKRQYLPSAGQAWSRALADKLAASSARERLTVMGPDLELETANCKDAE